MPKPKTKKAIMANEPDGIYFLKLVLYMIIGSLWLKVSDVNGAFQFPIPIGLIIGIVFASHEHFQIDRKVEYAVLLVAGLVGFWAPFGIYFFV